MAVRRLNLFLSIVHVHVVLLRVSSFSFQRSQHELLNDPCTDFNHIIERSHDFYGVNCLDFVVYSTLTYNRVTVCMDVGSRLKKTSSGSIASIMLVLIMAGD